MIPFLETALRCILGLISCLHCDTQGRLIVHGSGRSTLAVQACRRLRQLRVRPRVFCPRLSCCYQTDLTTLPTTSCGRRATTSLRGRKEKRACGRPLGIKVGVRSGQQIGSLFFQMLRLGFNCGTWAGKQQHYRQNSDALVSGRVVNSSHNTSVYTADTEPATFAPLPCSH